MDFIQELELYLDNTPELLGQKLVIVRAMQSGEFDDQQIRKAFAGWIGAGVAQYVAESGYKGRFGFFEHDVLISKYIAEEKKAILAGAYKELDLIAQEEALAAEGAEPAVAAPPETETAPAPKVEMSIEDFDDPDKLAAALVGQFAKPEDENYAEVLEEIKDSLDYNQSYDWRGMADFTADGDEYTVIRSEEQADLIAVDEIKDSMISEPESFAVGDWLKPFYYISDTDKRLISVEEADHHIDDLSDDDLVKEFGDDDEKEKHDQDKLDDKEMDKLRDRAKDEYSDTKYKEMEKDPIAYCQELGYEIGGENHPSFLQLNTGEAAQYANDTDGWAHQLSRYDGEFKSTPEGLVYFKR